MDIEKPITCKHDTLLVGCVACTEIEELQSQLETTQRELTAATISWENALAELDKAREQEPVGFIDANGDPILSIDGLKGGYLYRDPVPAMPMQDDRIAKEWQEIWNPIDELVRPLTPLGHSVAVKAVELIKQALAMLIPKQEPAGAVPDNGLEIAAKYIDGIGDHLEKKWKEYTETSTGGCATTFHTLCHELANEIRALSPSPRITEQDDDGLLPIDAGSHPDCRVMCWSESELRSIKDYARRCIAAAKTQRITEQDAREICAAYNDFMLLGHTLNPVSIINKFVNSEEGRALLAKLNGVSHE